MKRVIKATSGNKYDSKFVVTHGNQRYFCYMNKSANGSVELQLSKIAAYDDADYVWAKMGYNGQVIFYQSGKVIDKMQMHSYDPDDYENFDEYINDVIDSIVVELINMNKGIKPVMVHN